MKNTSILFIALTLIAGMTLAPVAGAGSCDRGHEHAGDSVTVTDEAKPSTLNQAAGMGATNPVGTGVHASEDGYYLGVPKREHRQPASESAHPSVDKNSATE